MTNQTELRTATIEDVEELIGMWAQYMRVHADNPAYNRFREDALDTRRRVFIQRIEEATSAILVLVDADGGLDGMLVCTLEENDPFLLPRRFVRIEAPFIREEARRQGNLHRLLKGVFEWARDWEVSEIRLHTGADNLMANAVADELGFHAIEVIRRYSLENPGEEFGQWPNSA